LQVLDHCPAGFLDVEACELTTILPQPTLLDLPGRRESPLFASILLHGDEDTGLRAMQQVLRRHAGSPLPRRLLVFVGNVAAAAQGLRRLDRQLDFNRAWPGTPDPDAPEAKLMGQVWAFAAERRPFASIDIHNNSGWNPHYACVTSLDAPFLNLASLFSRTLVHFDRPLGVQAAAMARICPAVTTECGRAGDIEATRHAAAFVEACLALDHLPERAPRAADIDLLHTFAIMKVPGEASMSFDGADADFCFRDDLDRLNFNELAAGTCFGRLGAGKSARLDVTRADDGTPLSLFTYDDGEICLAEDAIPSMLTRDVQAARLDCLGYLMRRVEL
jgi:hypothetical protein